MSSLSGSDTGGCRTPPASPSVSGQEYLDRGHPDFVRLAALHQQNKALGCRSTDKSANLGRRPGRLRRKPLSARKAKPRTSAGLTGKTPNPRRRSKAKSVSRLRQRSAVKPAKPTRKKPRRRAQPSNRLLSQVGLGPVSSASETDSSESRAHEANLQELLQELSESSTPPPPPAWPPDPDEYHQMMQEQIRNLHLKIVNLTRQVARLTAFVVTKIPR